MKNALVYFKKYKHLSPKQAWFLAWKLQQHRLEHSPFFFKLDLKHDKFKTQRREMKTERVYDLWRALTTSQRDMTVRFGHPRPLP